MVVYSDYVADFVIVLGLVERTLVEVVSLRLRKSFIVSDTSVSKVWQFLSCNSK